MTTFFHCQQTQEIVRLNGIYKRLLSSAGVTIHEGEGKVVSPNRVEVIQPDGLKQQYSAKHILIATGSRAQRVHIPGQVGMTIFSLSNLLFSYFLNPVASSKLCIPGSFMGCKT